MNLVASVLENNVRVVHKSTHCCCVNQRSTQQYRRTIHCEEQWTLKSAGQSHKDSRYFAL